MKYTNCQKYMATLPRAASMSALSASRLRLLCDKLGRVQLRQPKEYAISLPADASGHACAMLLEGAVIAAEHKTCRLSAAFGFDDRESILIQGKPASIDSYCKAVTELKRVAGQLEEPFFYEEAVFALGLLICKQEACEVVIFEGMSDNDFSLDAVCARYDLVLLPTVHAEIDEQARIKPYCDAIRRGTWEAVSGNQRSSVYNSIVAACAAVAIRVYLPKKANLSITELSLRHMAFDYDGKTGFSLRSPSERLADCALAVIEAAFALRRRGLSMPLDAIKSALAKVGETGCFELLSRTPDVILDAANTGDEVLSFLGTLDTVCRAGQLDLCICVGKDTSLSGLSKAFEGRTVRSLTVFSQNEETVSLKGIACSDVTFCKTASEAAKAALGAVIEGGTLLCFGGLLPLYELKREIIDQMNM